MAYCIYETLMELVLVTCSFSTHAFIYVILKLVLENCENMVSPGKMFIVVNLQFHIVTYSFDKVYLGFPYNYLHHLVYFKRKKDK